MPRTKSRPRKFTRRTTWKSHRFSHKKSSKVIPNLNYARQRCVDLKEIVVLQGQSVANVVIPWQQPQPAVIPANTTYIPFDKTPRIAKVKESWDQYAITGMKLEYMPYWTTSIIGVQPIANAIKQLLTVSDVNDYDRMAGKSDTAIITGPGFKNLNPYRPWKKFFSLKKLSKQQNVAWQNNTDIVPTGQTLESGLTKAATMLRFNMGTAAASNFPVGNVKVTWYVHMRGQVV